MENLKKQSRKIIAILLTLTLAFSTVANLGLATPIVNPIYCSVSTTFLGLQMHLRFCVGW